MVIHGFGKATLNDVRAFEIKNGIKLPNDYIEFLLEYNGGDVELIDENSFHVNDLGEDINIDVLFGVNTKEPELGMELWLNDYRSEMPQSAIIIGESYQHGFIVLLCSGTDTGVYYWDHAYEFPCSDDEANTYFIADTFTDIMKNLL